MARTRRRAADSGIYHVMHRGVNREIIYREDADNQRFLATLTVVKELSGCSVLGYCLMSNHYHLLLRTGGEPLGRLMHRLGVRYAGWFNHKYGRVGHVFQNRFTSIPVDDDPYFVTLVSYIWNNPVRAGIEKHPMDYGWNSCSPGQPIGLVDHDELTALLPSQDAAVELAAGRVSDPSQKRSVVMGRPIRHQPADVVRMLSALTGASSASEFAGLDEGVRLHAVATLRARSVALGAIGHATGLSVSQVRRLERLSRADEASSRAAA